MHKVVGSNPISRLRRPVICTSFFGSADRSVRLRRVGLIPDSRRGERRAASRNSRFASDSGRFEPKSVCRLRRRSSLLLAGAVSPLLLQRGVRACGRVPGPMPAIRVSGRVRFQSGNPESSARGWSRRAMAVDAVELLRQDGLRGSGEAPVTGGWDPWRLRGLIAAGVASWERRRLLAGDRAASSSSL
jgi:hypothetical protein